MRARGLVLKRALASRVPPGAETRRGQAHDQENPVNTPDPAGPLDGTQKATFVRGDNAEVTKIRPQNAQEREHDSQCAGPTLHPLLKQGDPEVKFGRRCVQAGRGGDRRE